MWPFKQKKIEHYRYKLIDWDKVTTVEDIVTILRNMKLTSSAQVPECDWEDPRFVKFLDTKITTKTYEDGFLVDVKESSNE